MKTTFAIARAPKYPQAALEWFKKNNLTPPAENKLEVINLGDDSVEINLLGSVGDTWDESGITEKDLRSALDAAKGKKILLNVNSPGGYVGEGLAFTTPSTRANPTSPAVSPDMPCLPPPFSRSPPAESSARKPPFG